MKTEKTLWTSITILVGVVIVILGLVRGAWQTWLLIGTFAVWAGWIITCLLMPYINRAKRVRIRKQQGNKETFGSIEATMMHHVNFRITAYIRSIYPNATWEWCVKSPVALIVNGGVGRIKVHGVEDFSHADVKIGKNGELHCSMVKVVPISDTESADDGNLPPNKQPVDPQLWYDTTGRAVLEQVIADLNSRGHTQLTIRENGEIAVRQEDQDVPMEQVTCFPAKTYWPLLVKVFQGEGLAAQVHDSTIEVTW